MRAPRRGGPTRGLTWSCRARLEGSIRGGSLPRPTLRSALAGASQKWGFSGASSNMATLAMISSRASSRPPQPSTRTHLPSSRSL